jgi:hypothetical protein
VTQEDKTKELVSPNHFLNSEDGEIINIPVTRILSNEIKISRIGGGFYVRIPKLWIEIFVNDIDKELVVTREIHSNTIVIKPVEVKNDRG